MKIIRRKPYLSTEDEVYSITITDFTAESAKDFMEDMFRMESDPYLTDIIIYITSYGGEILSLLSMIETIKISTKNVHVVAMGEADSCGAFITTTAPEGNRWMAPNSFMLIHEISDAMHGSASNFKKRSEHLQVMQDKIFEMVVKSSLLSIDGLKRRIKDHHGEWLITPEEALNLRLVDKIGVPRVKSNIIWELENE